jgi:Flp pilus assembly pilin Flp
MEQHRRPLGTCLCASSGRALVSHTIDPLMHLISDIISLFYRSFPERPRHDGGQTMAEYGILIAVIALVVIAAAVLLGGSISAILHNTAGKV